MTTMIRALTLCASLALPVGLAGATAPLNTAPWNDDAPPTDPIPGGSATAQVFHAMTGDALADMPVYAVRVIDPGGGPGVAPFGPFFTGPDGRALLEPLPAGTYEAFVHFNNHMSNVERFVIDEFTDFHPVVTLVFNPDID